MSVFRTYTTGLYNTLLSVTEAKKLKLFMGAKWMLDLPDGDRLCLLVNEPLSNIKNEVVIVVHGLAGAATDPSAVSVAQKFLQEGYHVVRMNLRGSGHGAGHARKIYHAGRDEDLASVVNAVSARYPGFPVGMVAMSLSCNMLFRYLAKDETNIVKRSVALSPVIDLDAASRRMSNAYFGLVNRNVLSILRSYFIKRQRAFSDTKVPDWNVIRRMVEFDDLFIAPELGFKDAKEYYSATTALPMLAELGTHAWRAVITLDDPIAVTEKKLFAKEYPNNSTILHSGGHLFMKKHGGLGEVAFKNFKQMP